MLNKEQIKELRDKFGKVSINKDIIDIFNKIPRDAYETGLLFMFCYNKLRNFNYLALKEDINKCRHVGNYCNFFGRIIGYTNSPVKKTEIWFMQETIKAYNEFIEDIINLVFDNFVEVRSSDDFDDVMSQIKELKK